MEHIQLLQCSTCERQTLYPAGGFWSQAGLPSCCHEASQGIVGWCQLLEWYPFFHLIFPRTGLYRIWTQFQRENTVNTTVFTVPVQAL